VRTVVESNSRSPTTSVSSWIRVPKISPELEQPMVADPA